MRMLLLLLTVTLPGMAYSDNVLSRDQAKQIIETSNIDSEKNFKKMVHLHSNGEATGIQHDIWTGKQPSWDGDLFVLTEKGVKIFEYRSWQNLQFTYTKSMTLIKPLGVEVTVTGIADAILPFTSTGGLKEVLFSWKYIDVPTPIKWIIAEGGTGIAYFRLFDDGWRLENLDKINYSNQPVRLSANEIAEEQADKDKITQIRLNAQKAEYERIQQKADNERRLNEQSLENEKRQQKAEDEEMQRKVESKCSSQNKDRLTFCYVSAIKEQIQRYWLQPPNTYSRLKCSTLVRLLPTGEVVSGSVRITRGSGNPGFDRSVEAAVYKASPLPVPRGELFESFRELEFVFDSAQSR